MRNISLLQILRYSLTELSLLWAHEHIQAKLDWRNLPSMISWITYICCILDTAFEIWAYSLCNRAHYLPSEAPIILIIYEWTGSWQAAGLIITLGHPQSLSCSSRLLPFLSVLLVAQIHCYRGWNVCLNIKIYKYLCSNLTNMSNFQPLEVVGRVSGTQLQVANNLNKLT